MFGEVNTAHTDTRLVLGETNSTHTSQTHTDVPVMVVDVNTGREDRQEIKVGTRIVNQHRAEGGHRPPGSH